MNSLLEKEQSQISYIPEQSIVAAEMREPGVYRRLMIAKIELENFKSYYGRRLSDLYTRTSRLWSVLMALENQIVSSHCSSCSVNAQSKCALISFPS